ncbi:hypothetical protein [Companilactobacillus halodurans]|uniref:hypothetical protein n=1 Tax=Companilactobacillus halodurans TaxID=2584183 RepID=UPI001EE7922C|nr:hypothetical protein [Companilactobacillus halodurans]
MKDKYYNRDLSWILFDNRVIDQAADPNVPFLEKLKFLAIASNNLDEFFRVRMHNVHSLVKNHEDDKRSGLSGEKVLDLAYKFNSENIVRQYDLFYKLMEEARDNDLFELMRYKELSDSEKNTSKNSLIRKSFQESICKDSQKDISSDEI